MAALIGHLLAAALLAVLCSVALPHAFRCAQPAVCASAPGTRPVCVCKPGNTQSLPLRAGAKALHTLHIPSNQYANNPFLLSPRQDVSPRRASILSVGMGSLRLLGSTRTRVPVPFAAWVPVVAPRTAIHQICCVLGNTASSPIAATSFELREQCIFCVSLIARPVTCQTKKV